MRTLNLPMLAGQPWKRTIGSLIVLQHWSFQGYPVQDLPLGPRIAADCCTQHSRSTYPSKCVGSCDTEQKYCIVYCIVLCTVLQCCFVLRLCEVVRTFLIRWSTSDVLQSAAASLASRRQTPLFLQYTACTYCTLIAAILLYSTCRYSTSLRKRTGRPRSMFDERNYKATSSSVRYNSSAHHRRGPPLSKQQYSTVHEEGRKSIALESICSCTRANTVLYYQAVRWYLINRTPGNGSCKFGA